LKKRRKKERRRRKKRKKGIFTHPFIHHSSLVHY
jgi:hypothetical protein